MDPKADPDSRIPKTRPRRSSSLMNEKGEKEHFNSSDSFGFVKFIVFLF
jgi:hypothetical protein